MQPPSASPFRTARLQVLSATWLSYAGFYVTRKVFGVVKGPMKERLGVDDLGISHAFTAYLIAYMLGQFLAAALSRRFTNRTLLLVGMSVSVLSNVLIGVVLPGGGASYIAIVAIMAIHGVAQATGWPCNVGLVASWTRRHERGTLMAFWGTCYQLGGGFAKAFAAFVFGWLGLLWPFFASSLALALVIVIFWFWAKERPETCGFSLGDEDEGAAPASESNDGTPKRRSAGGFGLVIALGLTYFGFKFIRYALDSWSALLLAERFHLDAKNAGIQSSIFDWIGFLGVIAGGWVSDRYFKSARLPVIVLMAIGSLLGVGLLLTHGATSHFAFVGLLGFIGFMLMGPDSLLSGAAAVESGSVRRAAMAAGIVNGLGSAGPIFQEPVIGWLLTKSGSTAVFQLLVAVSTTTVIATLLLWLGARRRGISL